MRLDANRSKSYTSFAVVTFAMITETFARTCRRQKRLQGQGVDASFFTSRRAAVAGSRLQADLRWQTLQIPNGVLQNGPAAEAGRSDDANDTGCGAAEL
jgi:hypothetical protein